MTKVVFDVKLFHLILKKSGKFFGEIYVLAIILFCTLKTLGILIIQLFKRSKMERKKPIGCGLYFHKWQYQVKGLKVNTMDSDVLLMLEHI